MNRRPRLVFVVTEDWYFWSHRSALAKAAIDAGYLVSVITRKGEFADRIRSAGIELHPWSVDRARLNPFAEAAAVRSLARHLRELNPDIVHNVALKPVLYGAIAARFSGCRRVVSAVAGLGHLYASGSFKMRALRPLLQLALKVLLNHSGSQVIAQNPEDRAWLAGLGVDARRLRLVRGAGVDTAKLSPSPEPPGPTTASMVSRMLRTKGGLDLVKAAQTLAAQGIPIKAQLVGPVDPGNRDSLSEDELNDLPAAGPVRWLGPRSDISAIWAKSHIAVLPSYYAEGLPKALLEAAACGRPMVATDAPGIREIVRHDDTGILVPARDPVALAGALERLHRDPELRRRLGARAREVAVTEFDDRQVIGQVFEIYQELMASELSE